MSTCSVSDLITAARELSPELIRIRRSFHQVPELGLQLPRTQQMLLEELSDLPLEISLGASLTSVVAVLRGRAPAPQRDAPADSATARPAVLLRADMDALPVEEDVDVPFRSQLAGRMHACGHDLHMAMGIGAARLLSGRREQLAGDVVFMFQPGEEGHDGAGAMLREGVLDAAGTRVSAAYALHVFSGAVPSGKFSTRSGTAMAASEDLAVVVHGRGGHASSPHRGNDPVTAVAEMILALQTTVTRKFDVFDPVVVTVGKLRAGHQRNTMPDTARFDATVRTFSSGARERIRELVPALIGGIATAHGLDATCRWEGGYPRLRNDAGAVELARENIADMFGPGRFEPLRRPFAVAEDFARVLEEVPGAMIALSAVPDGVDAADATFNHSPRAYFDEASMADGAALMAQLASASIAETQPAGPGADGYPGPAVAGAG